MMKTNSIAGFLVGALLCSPGLLRADVDISITGARLLDPYTLQPTARLEMSQSQTVMLWYEVDIMVDVFDGEETVTEKAEVNLELPATLKGAILTSNLGAGFGPGEVEKQNGDIVHAHDLEIIAGQLPAKANSVGTVVASEADCPAAPEDQANPPGVHPYSCQYVDQTKKYCKHFVGQGTTLELKAASGEVQEPGFPAPATRVYTVPYPCVWNDIVKQVKLPGQHQYQGGGSSSFRVPNVAPGTYEITMSVHDVVEDAVDINPANNTFSFTFELVVIERGPTLNEVGVFILVVLLVLSAWVVLRRRKAVVSRQ